MSDRPPAAEITLVAVLPTPAEYRLLRASVGWVVPDADVVATALRSSAGGVVARDGDQPVGMGRLVGDGVFYLMIVDLVVDPSRQKQGIGSLMVRSLEELACEKCVTGRLGVVADPAANDFWRSQAYQPDAATWLVRRLA